MHERLEHLLSLLPQAEARYRTAGSRLAALRRSAEAATRTEWATAPRYSPLPFGIERMRLTPGEVLPSPPQALLDVCRYGFAASGEVIYGYEYTSIEGRKYEEHWEHRPDRIETTLYDYHEPDKHVINVQTVLLSHSRPAGLVRYAMHGIVVEHYEYADGALVRMHRAEREHDPSSPRHALAYSQDEVVYRDGVVFEIVRHWADGNTERIFPEHDSPEHGAPDPDAPSARTAARAGATSVLPPASVADAILAPGREAQLAAQDALAKHARIRAEARWAAPVGVVGFALGGLIGHLLFGAVVVGALLGLGLAIAIARLVAARAG